MLDIFLGGGFAQPPPPPSKIKWSTPLGKVLRESDLYFTTIFFVEVEGENRKNYA